MNINSRKSKYVLIPPIQRLRIRFFGNICIPTVSSLPDKTFAGYQFVSQHCNEKEYVLFVDDDVFIKLNEIKDEMRIISPDIDSMRCLKGKCITTEDRANYLSKYFLWVDTYPHKYFIPRYSNGQESFKNLHRKFFGCIYGKHFQTKCTAMTISAARKIFEVARNTERRDFRIEDMLFTGIFRQKAGIEDIMPSSIPGQ